MKYTLLFLLSVFTLPAFAQRYPFANDFVKGSVIMNDHTVKTGEVRWFPQQTEKLNFREVGKNKIAKYAPEEIAGFTTDSLTFVSLLNFSAYADNYPAFGNLSSIKHTFAHLIDSGRFNIYFVVITRFNAFTRTVGSYPNFLFQDSRDSSHTLMPYPYAIRMPQRMYETPKQNLYFIFKDYPAIVEKVRNFNPQDDFFEIVDMVRAVNRK